VQIHEDTVRAALGRKTNTKDTTSFLQNVRAFLIFPELFLARGLLSHASCHLRKILSFLSIPWPQIILFFIAATVTGLVQSKD
jgi:hypothetical protein